MPDDPVHADRAVVDRIAASETVLLVGPEGTEAHIPAAELPGEAGEGIWVRVDQTGVRVRVIGVDDALTGSRRVDLDRRIQRLRGERRGGRF